MPDQADNLTHAWDENPRREDEQSLEDEQCETIDLTQTDPELPDPDQDPDTKDQDPQHDPDEEDPDEEDPDLPDTEDPELTRALNELETRYEKDDQ